MIAKNPTKKEKKEPSYKLPEDMVTTFVAKHKENEIRDCFNFYDNDRLGQINRSQVFVYVSDHR